MADMSWGEPDAMNIISASPRFNPRRDYSGLIIRHESVMSESRGAVGTCECLCERVAMRMNVRSIRNASAHANHLHCECCCDALACGLGVWSPGADGPGKGHDGVGEREGEC